MTEQPNFSYINQLSGGDSAFEKKLLAVVQRELPEEIEAYKKSLSDKNFKDAASMVHKLKHKISILGLEKTYYFAEEYEDELREGRCSRQDAFDEILKSMLAFVRQS